MTVDKIRRAAPAAAMLLLAACSGGSGVVSNEDAVPLIMDKTTGLTINEVLRELSSSIAEQFAGFSTFFNLDEKDPKTWDKARFKVEADKGFKPFDDQVDKAFTAALAKQMKEGEGAALLAELDKGENSTLVKCALGEKSQKQDDRWAWCAKEKGATVDPALKAKVETFSGHVGEALKADPTVAVAMGYVTCGMLATFARETDGADAVMRYKGTKVGLTGQSRACEEYDKLTAETLKGDTAPHFGAAAE